MEQLEQQAARIAPGMSRWLLKFSGGSVDGPYYVSALTRKRGNLDRAHSAFFGRLAFCERSASRSR